MYWLSADSTERQAGHSNARFPPVLKLAPQLRVDRCANGSVNADGMAKFSINNFESGTLVGSSPPVLTVFQIGLQHLTTMDHHMRSPFMTEPTSAETSGDGMRGSQANTGNKLHAKSVLTKIAALVADRNIPFLVCSIGMIVMLLWAGKFKMTAPGAEGIIPLVSNSPLTSWQFKVFGPYILGDMIGLTEWTAAILLIIGYFKPKVGIVGGIILVGMFFTTSSMLITTPDDTIVVHGMHYMNNLGLFLFKDIISFGVAFYLITYYGRKAIIAENQR